MRRATKWLAMLMILAMVAAVLLVGSVTAVAEETVPPPETQSTQLEGATGEGGGFGLTGGNTTVNVQSEGGEVNGTTTTTASATTVTAPDLVAVGSIEALIWDDSANPNGVFDEATPMIVVDGLQVILEIKNPDGSWKVYDDKTVSGPERPGFTRPWWIVPFPTGWGGGWVGWEDLPTNYTGPGYADYKLTLVPSGGYASTNGVERYAHLTSCGWWIYFYPQAADDPTPEDPFDFYRSYGVYKITSGIYGFKWHDYNADGVRQSNEPFLRDWTIALTFNGKVIKTTKTAADGSYSFSGLDPGTYQVWEASQWGWNQVHPLYRSCVRTPAYNYAKGNYKIVVERGKDYKGCNFGNLKMNTCSAYYYYNKFLLFRLYPFWLLGG